MFAFSGPQEVRELELGTDMVSVNNLLGFLEKVRPAPGRGWFKDLHCCSKQAKRSKPVSVSQTPPGVCSDSFQHDTALTSGQVLSCLS